MGYHKSSGGRPKAAPPPMIDGGRPRAAPPKSSTQISPQIAPTTAPQTAPQTAAQAAPRQPQDSPLNPHLLNPLLSSLQPGAKKRPQGRDHPGAWSRSGGRPRYACSHARQSTPSLKCRTLRVARRGPSLETIGQNNGRFNKMLLTPWFFSLIPNPHRFSILITNMISS